MKGASAALVPKLRFPEFRGKEEWEEEAMGEVYSFKGNNSLAREKLNYIAGSVKNIHYGDIHTKFASHFDITKESVPFVNASELSAIRDENFCAEGDMIFADASEDMADIGKCIELVSLSGEQLVSGLHTILARQIRNRLVLGFGGHLFKSGWIRTQIQKEAQGAKVLGISANRIRNLRLPLPSLPEQRKIASCLSSLDDLITAQARRVGALKKYKKGLMQQLFPREGETQPRLRFLEFQDAGEWGKTKLGNHVGIQSGYSPSGFALSSKGQYAFVKVEDLNNCIKYQVTGREFCNDSDGVVPTNSILFPKRGAAIVLNKIRITATAILIDTNLMALTPKDGLTVEFLYYYLSNVGLSHIADTSTIPQINNKHIIPFELLLPEEAEQHRIASCLSTLDAQITAETRKLEALKTHKKGLMQGLFPGSEK